MKSSVIHETEEEREEQRQLFWAAVEAFKRGDIDEYKSYFPLLKFEASSLMAGKKLFGADYLRELGVNTEYADAVYGPGWLDREEEDDWSHIYAKHRV